jgi:hypothetical protein
MKWTRTEQVEITEVLPIPYSLQDPEEIDRWLSEEFQRIEMPAELKEWFSKGKCTLVRFTHGVIWNDSVKVLALFEREVSGER